MSIQSTYGDAPARAKRGQIQRREYLNGRFAALEDLEPDVAVVYGGYPLNKEQIRKPMQTKFVIKANADFVSSNSTVGDITLTPLGGSPTTTSLTATVYSSSHDITGQAINTKIAAITGVRSSTWDATARTWTIITNGDIAVSAANFVTTLGSGGPSSYTYTAGSADTFAGFTTNIDKEPDDDGFCYKQGDTVKVLQRGRVSVVVEEAVTGSSDLFARFADDTGANEHRGVVRASAGSSPVVAMALGSQTGVYTAASADGIADLEINHLGA